MSKIIPDVHRAEPGCVYAVIFLANLLQARSEQTTYENWHWVAILYHSTLLKIYDTSAASYYSVPH